MNGSMWKEMESQGWGLVSALGDQAEDRYYYWD
jgi:hypothetical protein